MADYGGIGGGRSLRDALNELYPMTGLGEYGAGYPPTMFPPAGGADRPTGPVPLPQQRPPQAPGVLPPGMMAPGGLPPGLAQGPPPGIAGAPGQAGGSPDLARILMDLSGPGISPAASANPSLSTGQIANRWGIPASFDQAVSGQYPLGVAAVGRAIR